MEKTKYNRLQELDHSKFEIVKGEPDIRGWDVRYMTGQKLGSVDELIIDVQEKKVRYMVVDLDENELKLVHRKILIPIGLAELDKNEDDVVIPNITVEQLSRLPEYEKNSLNPIVERRISSTLGRELHEAELAGASTTHVKNEAATERKIIKEEKKIGTESDEHDPDFYSHQHYNVDNLYKNRLHQAAPPDNESEYYRGLRLWEKRSEGGLIEGNDDISNETNDLDDKLREEKRKTRRDDYRQRRANDIN